MNQGFVRVAAAVPVVRVADCGYNVSEIKRLIDEAVLKSADIVCFPELCITGATCGDLFRQRALLDAAREGLGEVKRYTADKNLVAIVGLPILVRGTVFDVAAVLYDGRLYGLIPKQVLTVTDRRCFVSGSEVKWSEFGNLMDVDDEADYVNFASDLLFDTGKFVFGVEVGRNASGTQSVSALRQACGADIIFNPAALPERAGGYERLKHAVLASSAQGRCGYVHVSAGEGESTTDSVYAGNAIVCENGVLLAEGSRYGLDSRLTCIEIDTGLLHAQRQLVEDAAETARDVKRLAEVIPLRQFRQASFDTLYRRIDPAPFLCPDEKRDTYCREILDMQLVGLSHRLEHTGSHCAVVGISGGLDSTLALLVTVMAFDRLNRDRREILGVTMPGFGTTGRTYNNALTLMRRLGITIHEISIKEACQQHFKDIGHDPSVHDVTYENSQARERTQILMDLANRKNGLVVGTGDLSELALGWATYNGDHMSMYGVNAGVPKTLVRMLVEWAAANCFDSSIAETLADIVNTPISPELVPADEAGNIVQKTEDLVGPYELHDFFLYHLLTHGSTPEKIFFLARQAFAGTHTPQVIKYWMRVFCRRFFSQQFKRSCMPDGPQVLDVSLSPRGAWQMPSDAVSRLWIEACDKLEA